MHEVKAQLREVQIQLDAKIDRDGVEFEAQLSHMARKDDLDKVEIEIASIQETLKLHHWMLTLITGDIALLIVKSFFGG